MDVPEISIILPVYFGEETLQATLDSLLNQTFQNFELLICVDGSQDRSNEIIQNMKDGRIKLFKNSQNLGIGRTLNRLVYQAHPLSQYIAIAEQDDWYYPDRLEVQRNFLEKHQDFGMVSGVAEHFDGKKVTTVFPGLLHHGEPYPENPKQMFLLNYREQIKVVNSCLMIRKKMHQDHGLYFTQHHLTVSVDWVYILRFSLLSKIGGLPRPLVRLSRREDRKTASKNSQAQSRAARELIRSAYYEFPNIISRADFKYALNTQIFLEMKGVGFPMVLLKMLEMLLMNPFDPRVKEVCFWILNKIGKKIQR